MAFDGTRRETVLFGGFHTDFIDEQVYRQTWAWNGQTWTFESQTGPSGRFHLSLAYDHARANVVFSGRENENGFGYCDHPFFCDTWTWDGAVWTKQNPR